jgi:hypothetical protein
MKRRRDSLKTSVVVDKKTSHGSVKKVRYKCLSAGVRKAFFGLC